jgi:hypothetical protein
MAAAGETPGGLGEGRGRAWAGWLIVGASEALAEPRGMDRTGHGGRWQDPGRGLGHG